MSMPTRPFLTTRAHEVFSLAHDLADRYGHDVVTPSHVLLGMLQEGRSVAIAALTNRGVPLDLLSHELEVVLPPPAPPRTKVADHAWSPSDEQLIEQAKAQSRELGTEFYGVEHLLLAILRDYTSAPAQVLERHGVLFDEARAEVVRIYGARPDEDAAV